MGHLEFCSNCGENNEFGKQGGHNRFYCPHCNTIFGDILLIDIEILIIDWTQIKAGDDAEETTLFPLENLPSPDFPYYERTLKMYHNKKLL